jgi:hypothetical protein
MGCVGDRIRRIIVVAFEWRRNDTLSRRRLGVWNQVPLYTGDDK